MSSSGSRSDSELDLDYELALRIALERSKVETGGSSGSATSPQPQLPRRRSSDAGAGSSRPPLSPAAPPRRPPRPTLPDARARRRQSAVSGRSWNARISGGNRRLSRARGALPPPAGARLGDHEPPPPPHPHAHQHRVTSGGGAGSGGVAGIAHPDGAGLVPSESAVAAFVRRMRWSEAYRTRLGTVFGWGKAGRASAVRGFLSVPAQRLREKTLSNRDVTSRAGHVRSPDHMARAAYAERVQLFGWKKRFLCV